MLSNWLIQQVKHLPTNKFPVIDVTELVPPDEGVMNSLALALLLAHGNPQQIRDQYEILLKDADENNLSILKKYLTAYYMIRGMTFLSYTQKRGGMTRY